MNLFDLEREKTLKKESPLSSRLRPQTLEDFEGQEHIVGKDKFLYRSIKADKLCSIVLYGPPGVGKTTLAKIVAKETKSNFVTINATNAGIKDIKETVKNAKDDLGIYGKKTILFIDEIHRFNKAQQDALLPHIEEGIITLIGATTENPYFEINKALVSRMVILEFKKLEKEDILNIVKKAIEDKEKGLGIYNVSIDDDALHYISSVSNGDARIALNALEIATLTTKATDDKLILTKNILENCIQKKVINYEKNGDNHYDTISAFIKSMRGSDPDASVYYLAKMLYAGEDIKFIARRIIICAAEDVGLANPKALEVAVSALKAVEFVGMPEAKIILSQAVIYIATSPKSNSAYTAIKSALEDVKNISVKSVPTHLKDGHYKGAKELGNGIGYKYAHSYENNYVSQQYLPDELVGTTYYTPTENGEELKNKQYMDMIKRGVNYD